MKALLLKVRAFAAWVWALMRDPGTKNALLVILLVMTGFGMVAPETATSMRDTIIALAFK